jgi:hypothetical protein
VLVYETRWDWILCEIVIGNCQERLMRKSKKYEEFVAIGHAKSHLKLHQYSPYSPLNTNFSNFSPFLLLIPGTHSRSSRQMDANRRRDLGESHRLRTKSSRCKSLRSRARSNSQRLRRRLRRNEVSLRKQSGSRGQT